MTATFLDDTPDGVTYGRPARLRRAADAAYADFFLGVAAAVTTVRDSDHPDLADKKITVTGKGFDRLHAAVALVAEEFSRHEHMPLDAAHAKIWDAYDHGTRLYALWLAVSDQRVSLYQARTIESAATRLEARIGTVHEVTDADGNLVDLTVDDGDRLLDGDAYTHALDRFLTAAIHHAQQGHTGQKLRYRLNRELRELTPGYEPLIITRRDDHAGVHIAVCDDELNAHTATVLPLAVATRLKAYVTAAADASAQHARANDLADDRTHGQRETDAFIDLINHALDQHVPASDPATPADDDHPVPRGRTHRPASSVQVHVRADATTLLGLDDHPAWVDGLGPVPAEVARDLATTTGAMWRAVITAPGTRDVLDVGATSYQISAAMRRFITDRDETCVAPGCTIPAVDCDLDHVIPWPHGKTTVNNLRSCCRRHHNHKTEFFYEDADLRQIRLNDGKPPWADLPDEPPF
jgi:hypothetical protein